MPLSSIIERMKPKAKAAKPDESFEDRVLDYINDRWEERKTAFVTYHQAIWQSILFYANQTWIDWDPNRKMYQPQQPADDWVPQPRINYFAPTIDAVASNFQAVPEVEASAVPNDDPTSIMVAAVANDLADQFIRDNALHADFKQQEDKAGRMAQFFTLAGCAFTEIDLELVNKGTRQKTAPVPAYGVTCPRCDTYNVVRQDASQGPPQACAVCGGPVQVTDTEEISPVPGEDGASVEEAISEWRVGLRAGNPLFAFPRPGATSMNDTRDMLWAERMDLNEVWQRFAYEAEADSEWPDGYNVQYEHALNYWYTGYSTVQAQTKDSCMVLRCFAEPGRIKDIPEGFYGVVINKKLVKADPWPYIEMPLTKGDYLPIPTLFFPRSVAFDIAEIQKELQTYESLIKLHGMTSAVEPIVVDDNTVVSEITGRADKVIHYRAVGPAAQAPHRMQAGHLDDGIYKQRDKLEANLRMISQAVNAFRGEQEGGITAASAISQLRAQAEQMFGKPVSNWNGLWCETVRKGVKFMQKKYQPHQLVEILGRGREIEIQAFLGADLDKCLSWVSSTHGLPKTRDEKRQEFITLWDHKALDISDPNVKQKLFQLFGETGMMVTFNRDATRARIENSMMEQGQLCRVMPAIEDLDTHLYVHLDKAKSLEFDKWTDQAKQLLIEHIMETRQAKAAQMMPPPMPGPPGKGPIQPGAPAPGPVAPPPAAVPPPGGP